MTRAEFLEEVAELAAWTEFGVRFEWAKYDPETDRHDGPSMPAINCNDLFWWASADCEEVTPENIGSLRETLEEVRARFGRDSKEALCWANLLWCARVRKMRPQGAAYPEHLPEMCELLDAAGPERNPKEPGNTPRKSRKMQSAGAGE